MAIIDSQVHAYEANTPQRPWASVPNWPPHVTGDEMVAAMDKVGVDGSIFISAFSLYQYDASYAIEVQRKHPGRFAIIKPVNPADPAVGEVIAEWKRQPGAVAVRIMMTSREAGLRPDDPGVDRIAREAARHGFPVNVLFWGNVDAGTALIDRHPGTRFIVDHMAIQQPRTPPAPPQPWADLPKVLELAKRENAVIKVSGACTLSREPYPFQDIWNPLARVFDAWGFDRVQSVPHKQRSKHQASNTRASGSQISGKGYGSRDSVQAPLTLITAFGRLASSSTFGRSVHGSRGAGGTRGCKMPRWSMMNRVSGWRSMSAAPASTLPQHSMLTGKSYRTAARRIRSSPGWFGSRPASFVIMIRMPTAPGVFFQSAMTSATAGSSGSTGLTRANRPG